MDLDAGEWDRMLRHTLEDGRLSNSEEEVRGKPAPGRLRKLWPRAGRRVY